jgi:hypothetical protein
VSEPGAAWNKFTSELAMSGGPGVYSHDGAGRAVPGVDVAVSIAKVRSGRTRCELRPASLPSIRATQFPLAQAPHQHPEPLDFLSQDKDHFLNANAASPHGPGPR